MGRGPVAPLRASALLLAVVLEAIAVVTLPGGDARPVPGPACRTDGCAGGVLTPYPDPRPASRFIQGAALDLRLVPDAGVGLGRDLQTMRDRYHVNTVSLYGLEDFDPDGGQARKDLLFAHLRRLGMSAVVRVEGYDTATFAFRPGDAEAVVGAYRRLLAYVSAPGRRESIAYVMLNMPVDDPVVQGRVDGVNSTVSKRRQSEYARTLVAGVRAVLAGNGFPAARVFLGVFYGWDASYDLPSYAPAHPDGYVLTNYSYPAGPVPDARSPDAVLINRAGLRRIVDRFRGQYGAAPVVVEYGFHTAVSGQAAGLVRDRAAKLRALLATTRFYRSCRPRPRGTVYFGYNIVKVEGSPAGEVDFALDPEAGLKTGR
ncbi:hypothetical protein HC031_21290 [Planosporangium thailandense]|uniref:GH26 domain-containing protein n=1 Tax=Planosporangium thailandense TaxID=765197 RepID=A0ABX0Y491_9ACTN|nr:hypothetical protein [Planosporangium thailandense]NJC72233.1 hypothetical protein [Planosporangium thailandense]